MKTLFRALLGFQVLMLGAILIHALGYGGYSIMFFWFCLPTLGFIIWKWFPVQPNVKIAAMALFCALLAMFWNNDMALISAWVYDHGATLPYGSVWFPLNPFWSMPGTTNPTWGWPWQLDYHAYLYYLLAIQMAVLGLMLKMPKTFSKRYVFWTQVFNAMLVLIHNPQSIVAMQFAYLIPITPVFLSIFLVIKFPFGWQGGFSNPHVQCFTGAIQLQYGDFHAACGHFLWDYVWNDRNSTFTTVNVFLVGLVLLLIFHYWYKQKPRRLKIPLPRGRCVAITMNGKKLVFGIALWKGQEKKAIITNVFPCPMDTVGTVDSAAVVEEIRNEDNHGRE